MSPQLIKGIGGGSHCRQWDTEAAPLQGQLDNAQDSADEGYCINAAVSLQRNVLVLDLSIFQQSNVTN